MNECCVIQMRLSGGTHADGAPKVGVRAGTRNPFRRTCHTEDTPGDTIRYGILLNPTPRPSTTLRTKLTKPQNMVPVVLLYEQGSPQYGLTGCLIPNESLLLLVATNMGCRTMTPCPPCVNGRGPTSVVIASRTVFTAPALSVSPANEEDGRENDAVSNQQIPMSV